MGTATGIIRALNSGVKHLAVKRFTLKYPEEKLKFVGDGYQYDPTTGVGVAGLKGRHMLFHDHCTGCQLCSIACEGVAEAMVKVLEAEQKSDNEIMALLSKDSNHLVQIQTQIVPKDMTLLISSSEEVITKTVQYSNRPNVNHMAAELT